MLKQIKQITVLSAWLSWCGFTSTTHEFNWTDINTREVIRWDGDTAIIEQGSSAKELGCTIKLNQKEIDFAIESFGIPEQWITISYSNEEDLIKHFKPAFNAKHNDYKCKEISNLIKDNKGGSG